MNSAWPRVPLGEVLAPAARSERVEPLKEYRLLGVRLEGQGPFLRETVIGSQVSATKLFRVAEGDFIYSRLFASRGAFGVISRELDGCHVSGEFPTFIPIDHRLDVRFLFHWFRLPTTMALVDKNCSGSTPLTRNRFKEEFFLCLEVPLPPLAEQRRIATWIGELMVHVSKARVLRRQADDEADMLWTQEAEEVFNRAAREFPASRLAERVEIRGGGTPSKANPAFWEGDVPWVSPKDMKTRAIRDSADHISREAITQSAAKLIEPGAVLVVVRGMILAHTVPSAVLENPSAINQDMKALIPKRELLPEYLCNLFWARNRELLALVERSTHDTRKLETPRLMDMVIPVPPLTEQRRIVAYLDALQAKVHALRGLQSDSAIQLDALLPSILDRAFKGTL